MLNLDTHILLHALDGNLTPKEASLLSAHQWSISAIVLWEISILARLHRIEIDLNDTEFSRKISGVVLWPITLEICREINQLDFKSDPADEIIASTSIFHHIPLVTRDRVLLGSKKIPLAKSK